MLQVNAANDIWTADCKGEFKTLDGQYCYPLTVADGFSRYLLGVQFLLSSRLSVWWIMLGIFPELTEPASSRQNGRHERMHKTLKQATARPPAAK